MVENEAIYNNDKVQDRRAGQDSSESVDSSVITTRGLSPNQHGAVKHATKLTEIPRMWGTNYLFIGLNN